MYACCWRLCVGATSNVVKIIVEAASPGKEGQGMSGPSEEIARYLHRRLCTSLYEVSAAKGQAREAESCFCTSNLSNLRDRKKCHKARFTTIYIHTPSI